MNQGTEWFLVPDALLEVWQAIGILFSDVSPDVDSFVATRESAAGVFQELERVSGNGPCIRLSVLLSA